VQRICNFLRIEKHQTKCIVGGNQCKVTKRITTSAHHHKEVGKLGKDHSTTSTLLEVISQTSCS